MLKRSRVEQNYSQTHTGAAVSYLSAVRSQHCLQAYEASEVSSFLIKAHSSSELERNMMPDSSCVQPEKLAEVSQLLVTRQKLNK